MRKIIFLLFFIPLSALASEITCPTVAEIKDNQLHGWLMLYESNEELISKKDAEIFRQQVATFESAKWNRYYLENGRCFYAGNNNIILAHDAWRPARSIHWTWLIPESYAECKSNNVLDCQFTI